MLEVMRSYFKLSPKQMRQEIVALHKQTVEVLRQKGIDYGSLRSGLAPVLNRHEAAFIFDSSEIKSSWYGRDSGSHLRATNLAVDRLFRH
ncbi:MAG: hypothetical protein OZ935_19055 [Pseudomonadota bacterium]|nr:hypothetical protein [Pseudomonadota bacterium]